MARNVIIMGAAGRDFHDFLVYFKDSTEYRVVAFTATQIPYISDRILPASLTGPSYPNGIRVYPEERLEELIDSLEVAEVYFAYSDVSDTYVMNLASIVQAKGAGFHLLGPKDTMINASKPVVAVVADRTGAGKSTISRMVADVLVKMGLKPVVVRHPMPYGIYQLRCRDLKRTMTLTDTTRPSRSAKNTKGTSTRGSSSSPESTTGRYSNRPRKKVT